MDTEALKIILKLQEENILLKRAILDASFLLKKRGKHIILEYGLKELSFLFSEIESILTDFENKQQPTQ